MDYEELNGKLKTLSELIELSESSYMNEKDMMSALNDEMESLDKDFENYKPKLYLGYKLLHPDAVPPKYNYGGDSGFDLHSMEEITIEPFGRALIPTGISLDIKDGYEIQVRSKSGLALKEGLFVLNSPGTVDCFSEDMKILTIDGEKLISELKINDVVFSFNERTLEVEKDVVVNIFDTETQEILTIETDEGVLEVTPNSEIYTVNGIILAKNLKENDEIIVF
jgi:dUTP pyrophosphatase